YDFAQNAAPRSYRFIRWVSKPPKGLPQTDRSPGSTIVFAIIVLGLAANYTSETQAADGITLDFAALAIATAVLTLVSLPAMLIIDAVRDGAFTSMVVTELATLFVLWVLWLATAAYTTNIFDSAFYFSGSCNDLFPEYRPVCHQYQALMAFSWLAWLALFIYSVYVFVLAIIGANRGQRVWTATAKELGAGGAGAGSATPAAFNNAPMQQHQYPPTTAATPSAANHAAV
ncbi:hypothetical protein HWV62_5604, partial [Athelia sp. TMB]